MRIKVTEIEASAEELRQSNSLAESFTRMMRNAFKGADTIYEDEEEEDDE